MKLLIAGDFVPQNRVKELFENNEFQFVLGDIKPIVGDADYSIVNLESPVIKNDETPIAKTGPNLHCAPSAIHALSWAGFNCVTLANNHFFDQGQPGILDTISMCEKYGIEYVGGGRNIEEASRTLDVEICGEKLSIINCCESEWSIATMKHGGSNPLDPIAVFYKIQWSKKRSDHIIVIVHGGIEGFAYPTIRMRDMYRFFIDAGADAVLNHHQHCCCGYEMYHGKPIFYGLGNFCFDCLDEMPYKEWNYGCLVSLDLVNDTITPRLIPVKQCTPEPTVSICSWDLFDKRLDLLNSSILDDNTLTRLWHEYVDCYNSNYLNVIDSYSNRMFNFMKRFRLLPSLLTQEKLRRLKVFVQCESHRERLVNALEHKLMSR